MTRKELNTHIEKRYSECCKRSQGLSYGSFYDGYVDCYCEQQKRIEKLEAQIEKMKCCGNCAKNGHICVAEEMQGNLCGKNKDKWELRR